MTTGHSSAVGVAERVADLQERDDVTGAIELLVGEGDAHAQADGNGNAVLVVGAARCRSSPAQAATLPRRLRLASAPNRERFSFGSPAAERPCVATDWIGRGTRTEAGIRTEGSLPAATYPAWMVSKSSSRTGSGGMSSYVELARYVTALEVETQARRRRLQDLSYLSYREMRRLVAVSRVAQPAS